MTRFIAGGAIEQGDFPGDEKPPLIVGLGSHHGDDRAGWLVIDRLEENRYPAESLLRIVHAVDLLDRANPEQPLVICDACQGSGIPGQTSRWSWPSTMIAILRHCGTHDLSLGEVLELGHALNRLPDRIAVWGIEGTNWSPASEPSLAVKAAAVDLADSFCRNSRDA